MGGVISLNMVNGDALAAITDSVVVTTVGSAGTVAVESRNAASIDATSTTRSKVANAMGLVVSLNTVGYDSSNILFSVVESLLGTDIFSPEPPASASSTLVDTTVTADGDVRVAAVNAAQLNATAGNEQISEVIKTLVIDSKGWSGSTAGVLVALNKVSSDADALITDSIVTAAGTLDVAGSDTSAIDANSRVVSASSTENNLKGVVDLLEGLLPYDYHYTTASGTVLVMDGEPFTGTDVLFQTRVRLGANYGHGGAGGAVYKYSGLLPRNVDLGTENYTASWWKKVIGGGGGSVGSLPRHRKPDEFGFQGGGGDRGCQRSAFGWIGVCAEHVGNRG